MSGIFGSYLACNTYRLCDRLLLLFTELYSRSVMIPYTNFKMDLPQLCNRQKDL